MKDEICNMIEKVARYADTDSICGIRDNCKITAAKLMLNSLYGKKSINSLFKFSEYTGNGEK